MKRSLFLRSIAAAMAMAFMISFVPELKDTVSFDVYADETAAEPFIENVIPDSEDAAGNDETDDQNSSTDNMYNGMCGDEAYWSLSDAGILTIGGVGSTFDYQWQVDDEMHEFVDTPWYSMRDTISAIVIEDGIVSLGACLFAGCYNVLTIDIADSVAYISGTAFDGVENSPIAENTYGISGISAYNDYKLTALDDNAEKARYSVLILDASSSMRGTPLKVQKEAAKKFCESVLGSDGTNYIAIVKLNSDPIVGVEFTNDLDKLTTYIDDNISASGTTNTNGALEISDELLSEVPGNSIKNIILCSDGLPEGGKQSYDGTYAFYSQTQKIHYTYANAVYNTASALKEKYNIYTLAFFHSLKDRDKEFGRVVMNDVQNAGYYEVTDPDLLEFTFDDLAGDVINGGAVKKSTSDI